MALDWRLRPIIAMIHVGALPGTPAYGGSLGAVRETALREAELYTVAGVDAIMLENMHDTPYLRGGVGPEIAAPLAVLTDAVRRASGLPCGVQVLAGANHAALAVALAAGLDFVRAEGFVFAHVADEGLIQSSAGELLRYRRAIGAEHVQVWADVKKKHSAHAITADVDIAATAEAAEFFRADAVIVTGAATGKEPLLEDLRQVQGGCRLPVLLGSGINPANLARYWADADGFIVGSALKAGGRWDAPVDPERVAALMTEARRLRGTAE
jgi:membrane complex biogenesis BtpA family protein